MRGDLRINYTQDESQIKHVTHLWYSKKIFLFQGAGENGVKRTQTSLRSYTSRGDILKHNWSRVLVHVVMLLNHKHSTQRKISPHEAFFGKKSPGVHAVHEFLEDQEAVFSTEKYTAVLEKIYAQKKKRIKAAIRKVHKKQKVVFNTGDLVYCLADEKNVHCKLAHDWYPLWRKHTRCKTHVRKPFMLKHNTHRHTHTKTYRTHTHTH